MGDHVPDGSDECATDPALTTQDRRWRRGQAALALWARAVRRLWAAFLFRQMMYRRISVNGTSTPVGGCQFKLNAGDQVAFTWTAF
jgi:hypothetical protein